MNNWLNLKGCSLHCRSTDLIVCQFSFEEDQLVQAKLIIKREREKKASLAFLHYSPELCALRFVAPNRLRGSEHPSVSDEASLRAAGVEMRTRTHTPTLALQITQRAVGFSK